MQSEVAWCCEDSVTSRFVSQCAWMGLRLSVTSLVEEYKVADIILQSMTCESKDDLLQENVPEVKSRKKS